MESVGPRPIVGNSSKIAFLLWVAVFAVPVITLLGSLGAMGTTLRPQIVLLGLTSIIIGFAVFFAHGGSVITPSGFYFLVNGLLTGASSLWIATSHPNQITPELVYVATAILLSTAATWLVWRLSPRPKPPAGSANYLAVALAAQYPFLLMLGVVLMGISAAAQSLGFDAGPLVPTAGYLGVVAVGFGYAGATRRSVGPRGLIVLAVLGAVFISYLALFFSGFGRIHLATLAACLLMGLNITRPCKWHKYVAVVALLPALVLAGQIRAPDSADKSARAVLAQAEGLGSVYSPILTFAELVRLDRQEAITGFPRQYGRTFFEASVTWVPRQVWAEKPLGLGARLTRILRPSLVREDHSMAALAYGEWYINFAWPGLALMAMIFGCLLSILDRWLVTTATHRGPPRAIVLREIAIVVATTGLANYLWGGAFTFMARNGLVLAVLGLVGLLVSAGNNRSSRRTLATTR